MAIDTWQFNAIPDPTDSRLDSVLDGHSDMQDIIRSTVKNGNTDRLTYFINGSL